MHVATRIKLSHGGIYNGISRAAFAPSAELLVVVFPFYVAVFGLEGFVHTHVGPVRENVFVEVPPGYFADPDLDAFFTCVELLGGVVISCCADGASC